MSPRPLKSHRESFGECLELARNGGHHQALDRLLAAVATAPLHPQHRAAAVEALVHLARMSEAASDLANAERALTEAARVAPRFADVQYRLACVRLRQGRRPEARAALVDALRVNPRYVAARLEMALLDAREGRLGESLATLRALGQETPLEEPRIFAEGLASLEHADWDQAGRLLREALRLDRPGVQEMIQEFHQRMARGDRAGAALLVRQALRTHESYEDLHYLLGTAELEESHLDDAISSLARALELHPDYHAARVQLARALEALGDLAQAEEQIGWVLQADPQHPQALELSERWSRMHPRRRGAPVGRQAS